MKGKAVLVEAGEVALALLKLTVASSDWNPPLKAATGGALHIVELIKVSVHPRFFEIRTAHTKSRVFDHIAKSGTRSATTYRIRWHGLFGPFQMPLIHEMTSNRAWRSYRCECLCADINICYSHKSFSKLEGIKQSIEDRQKTSPAKAFWNYIKNQDSINSMKKDLDMTLQQFQVSPFAFVRLYAWALIPPNSWNS
jgi:hypothetical protein